MEYEKATVEIIYFSNEDIITTSGNDEYICGAWANQNGVPCAYGLTRI